MSCPPNRLPLTIRSGTGCDLPPLPRPRPLRDKPSRGDAVSVAELSALDTLLLAFCDAGATEAGRKLRELPPSAPPRPLRGPLGRFCRGLCPVELCDGCVGASVCILDIEMSADGTCTGNTMPCNPDPSVVLMVWIGGDFKTKWESLEGEECS